MRVGKPQVLLALLVVLSVRVHCFTGEDLDGAVEPILAVVDIHPIQALLVGLLQALQDAPEPNGEEDSVGVDLHRPVAEAELAVAEDLLPEGYEDAGVQRRARVAPVLAPQVAADGGAPHSRTDLQHGAAVEGVLIASEDALLLPELQLQQPQLIASWLQKGEAEERPGLAAPEGQAGHDVLSPLAPRHRTVRPWTQQGADKAVLLAPGPRPAAEVCLALLATHARVRHVVDVGIGLAFVLQALLHCAALRLRRADRPPELIAPLLRGLRALALAAGAHAHPEPVAVARAVVAALRPLHHARVGSLDVREPQVPRGALADGLHRDRSHADAGAISTVDLPEAGSSRHRQGLRRPGCRRRLRGRRRGARRRRGGGRPRGARPGRGGRRRRAGAGPARRFLRSAAEGARRPQEPEVEGGIGLALAGADVAAEPAAAQLAAVPGDDALAPRHAPAEVLALREVQHAVGAAAVKRVPHPRQELPAAGGVAIAALVQRPSPGDGRWPPEPEVKEAVVLAGRGRHALAEPALAWLVVAVDH
mmetsp:Transcript_70464/g.228164  ORF Transcript_70464/g.228164 Transcript_70464/m.228164 type:complete len:535 (+) Transcript_70464:343-1947(+)